MIRKIHLALLIDSRIRDSRQSFSSCSLSMPNSVKVLERLVEIRKVNHHRSSNDPQKRTGGARYFQAASKGIYSMW